ncbi:MAG: DNA topoisomerase IV subunit A [Acholeplasmatales bacterium]|nr:DNA topoisomerase IV subunit A [Acholeplasmatales bacterium]
MAKKKDIISELDKFANETFQVAKLEDVIGDRFARYSKAIIQERAIPDVRDGLKPVQRRILFGMGQLKLVSTSPYKKCAKVVGDVMGKYHPHGDSSIYEALVHMSQNWKMGVRLVDLQGNNGSIDGDGPAASRYTECRMTREADYLLQDIEKKTVEMIDNYDGEEKEPTVLPARFPNLLVNGGMGISSGYATYIPPHNINEVVNATIYKIDHPNMTIDELLEIMPGPDFPTGGIAMGKQGIREAFLTGSGTVVVKSKLEMEDFGKKQRRIVITEIPFDTVKQKTVEKIEQIRIDHKVEGIEEVRDETDRHGIRIAIDLKEGANEDAIIKYLFKNTNLQSNIKYNMVVIRNMRPERLGVLDILDAYIDHQKDVVTNRTNFLKAKDLHRLEIVDGLIKMVSILSEVISTIRKSLNKQDAKEKLMSNFEFTEIQTDAILAMQLYRLSNTDVTALHNEHDTLTNNIEAYDKILSSEKNLLKVIKQELKDVASKIDQPRRTVIEDEVTDLSVDESDLILEEKNIVVATKLGFLKRISLKSYNASSVNTTSDKDSIIFEKEVSTLDTLIGITNKGNFVYVPVYKIDECKTRDTGEFVNNICQIDASERFVEFFDIKDFNKNLTVLLASHNGIIKQTAISEFSVSRFTKEVRCMKLDEDDYIVSADITDNPLEIICGTSETNVIRFRASDVSLYGKNAQGIRAMKIHDKETLAGALYANKNDDLLLLTSRGTLKRIKVEDLVISKRGRAGERQIKKVKSNPFNLVALKKLTPNQYKENVSINVIYETGNDYISSFDLKYNVSDSGKDITKDGLGYPLNIYLPKPAKADEVPNSDYLLDMTSDIDLFNYDTIDEAPLKKESKGSGSLDLLDQILCKEEHKEEKSTLLDEQKALEDLVNINTLEKVDNKEVLTTDDGIITKTKASTIVRRKRPSFFDDDNE